MRRPRLEDPLDVQQVDTLDPAYTKGRIFDDEEKLYLQQIWEKAGRGWLVLGNLLLVGLAAYARLSNRPEFRSLAASFLVAAVVSVVASPVVVYTQFKRTRKTRLHLRRLNYLYRQQLLERDAGSSAVAGSLANQRRYREDMPDLISQFREEAGRVRRIHNRFQSTIIVGSVLASATTTASVSYSQTRWLAVVITAFVGLAAGFTGYFKYHERSFNLQQTADAVEREYEAVELRVGRYAGKSDEEAYALFADVVERLRDEQNKRQQQLDQPVEMKREGG